MNDWWNGITDPLRVQIGRNEVSIKLAVDWMALRTNWEVNLIKTSSLLNQQLMYCLYAPVVSSKGSKRDQYRMSNSEIACTHYLRVYNGQSSVSSSVVNTTWYSLPALGKYFVLSPVRGGGFSQFPSRQHPDQPDWPGTIACRIDWGFISRTTTVEQIRKRPTNTSHHFPSRYSKQTQNGHWSFVCWNGCEITMLMTTVMPPRMVLVYGPHLAQKIICPLDKTWECQTEDRKC